MNQLEIAEHAICTFERIQGLNVTVHDLAGTLNPFLNPTRFYHRSPLCLAVKAQGRAECCSQFENTRLRRDLASQPEGRIHVCHAGLVEWVVPVFSKQQLIWVLFAGPRLPGKRLVSAFKEHQIPWPTSPWSRKATLPCPVEEDEAQLILEHLRQLAARLQKWAGELNLQPTAAQRKSHPFPAHSVTARHISIRRFVEVEYANPITLPMLAKRLCLSESRTSHAVSESCGTSFRELLIKKRLSAATELLRHSDMSVLEVALSCGFEDVTHFHRLFRRRIGTTPAKFRIDGIS
jgi:AraC-like DNA-binding protein